MIKDSIFNAGSEQCCANTGPERCCAKINNNTSCYTNRVSNSNLSNRPYNAFLPTVNYNVITWSLPGPSRETITNNGGNLNNRHYNAPLSNNNEIKYFLLGPSKDSDKKASTEIRKQLHKEFEDVFTGIGCFDGTFSLQVKQDSKPYQASPRHVAYALQKPFKEELETLQQQDIITP